MDLLDEDGRLLGVVNIIDALVVLLVVAVVAAGGALVLSGNDNADQMDAGDASMTNVTYENNTVSIRIRGVQPYVAEAIPDGPVTSTAIVAVETKSIEPTAVVVRAENGTLHERLHPQKRTVTLAVTLNVTVTNSSADTDRPITYTFKGKPLEIGRHFTLDYGPVTARGTITRLEPQN